MAFLIWMLLGLIGVGVAIINVAAEFKRRKEAHQKWEEFENTRRKGKI